MDQQKLQALAQQLQDELNQAVHGFQTRGAEHFKKVLAVAGVLAVVGYMGLFRTTSAQLKTLHQKVTQLRDIAKYAKEYQEDKMKLAGIKDKFPGEAEHKDWLFNLLMTSAHEEGISVDSISTQKEEEKGDLPFVKLEIDVMAKATYAQAGAWIARLEGTGKFTQVEVLTFTKARDPNPDAPPSGMNALQITLATALPKGVEGL